jgi:hypothetical protein
MSSVNSRQPVSLGDEEAVKDELEPIPGHYKAILRIPN